MNVSLSLNDIYTMLSGLSVDNKKWLAERLMQDTAKTRSKGLDFPHIPSHRKVSKAVLNMAVGTLPEGFDVEKELEKMWEERAL